MIVTSSSTGERPDRESRALRRPARVRAWQQARRSGRAPVAAAVALAVLTCWLAAGCAASRSRPSSLGSAGPAAPASAPSPAPAEEELVGPPAPEGLRGSDEIVGPPAPPPEARTADAAHLPDEPPRQRFAPSAGDALLAALHAEGIAAQPSARGVAIVLPESVFEYGTSDLPRESRRRIRDVARVIVEHAAGTRVSVEGHTDSIGADLYNKGLSERRAKAVEAELVSGGVAGKLISSRGFGGERPVAPNVRADGTDDPQGRARNRRVEVIVETGPVGML